MSTAEIVGLVLTYVVMVVGLAGCVVPALPGTPLVLLAAVLHKLFFGSEGVGWIIMTVLVGLTAISLVLEHIVSAYGARRFGATWRGVLGAVVGGVIGLFFGLVGILIGPFLGAAVFELLGQRTLEESGRAGMGATIGLLLASAAKIVCAVMMIGLFSLSVFTH